MLKNVIIPIFIPHKGCPFDCIYCNQKAISGQIKEIGIDEVIFKIDSYIKTIKPGSIVDIAFYGGSFTGIDENEQKRYLECANKYISSGKVNGIRISTRPDYINTKCLDVLSYYKINLIELGVQSFDKEVLDLSKRGHSVDDVYKAIELIKSYNIKFGIQTMIGLPGDNLEKSIETAKIVANLKPYAVRIYPTLVIKDTYLEKLFYENKYKPLDLDEAVNITAEVLRIYNSKKINVIRLGLQPTENIKEGRDLISGPFHPAFRHLVDSRIMLDKIENELERMNLTKNDAIIIYANRKIISNVIGINKENQKIINEKYKFRDVIFREDNQLSELFCISKL